MQRNSHSNKIHKPHTHLVANNPQYDKQYDEGDDTSVINRMLYDESDDVRRRTDLVKRMVGSYRKRKRQEKIDKLRSRENHWKGLENYDVGSGINEDINSFTNQFRQTYRSGKMLTFRQWCDKIEELLDTLND